MRFFLFWKERIYFRHICAFIGLILTLSSPFYFPTWRLCFFAPFLILSLYQRPLMYALWYSFSCGLIMDLMSAHTHLGLYALSYSSISWILNHYKKYFFLQDLPTLPIMTLFFGSLSSFLLWILVNIFEHSISFSLKLIFTDFILYPLFESAYALIISYLMITSSSISRQ